MSGSRDGADEESLRATGRAQQLIEAAAIKGVLECAPAFDSLGIFFDPQQLAEAAPAGEEPFTWIQTRIRHLLSDSKDQAENTTPPVLHELPVCYEARFAPDLEAVAQHTGLSTAEVIARHCGAEYRVRCVGFLPGFPYLAGLPRALGTPRRATPRTEVAAGAVGIGGPLTGVYPTKSPGGWNLIGRTPVPMFDPTANPPARLRTGARVRFVAITSAEYERFSA
ncbi:MAG: 5-oxoprolinase subunit PxpB [Chthoniobacterales bacterium]|nr:5-oxoprolinase subunit PxpB [Chthoniobacterales bacterium]